MSTPTSSSPVRFDLVALDTDDPAALARFYCDLLGWQVERGDESDDWVTIRADDGTGPGAGARLAFQLATDFVAPTWPDPAVPQQAHLDLAVDDLETAGAYAESIGARRVHGPGTEQDFWVYLDPSGHPFCLCRTGAGAPGDGSGEAG
ncbi:VOC family protein [Microlunatus spumicola]|uniref:VOC family protein n=1 Tax=Microlunatus spumicola TaxID=81499 RepID=UPI00195B04F9